MQEPVLVLTRRMSNQCDRGAARYCLDAEGRGAAEGDA